MHVVCVGLATLDTIFAVPHHPEPDGRVIATDLVVAGGGPAATAAVTLARLGIETYFVGAVGDDDVGADVRAGLEREGVEVSELAAVPGAGSPRSTILVSGAERSIVHFPGSLPGLELSARTRDLCERAVWVHVDHVGFGPVQGLTRARVSVDGGNPIEGLDLSRVALYAPPESELPDPQAALDAGAELVVVTRGAAGSVAYLSNGEVVEAAGFAVDIVSTLGAGDVFHGALVAFLARGTDLREALEGANRAAALSCRALDGRSAIPSLEELERSAA
jgi:sugar/nucleoside kinase (ribokinase family)